MSLKTYINPNAIKEKSIEKKHLAETVQTSLGKADNAVTSARASSTATTLTVENGVLNIPTATTGRTGLVTLSNSTSSPNDESNAATPKAVYAISELANSAYRKATAVTADFNAFSATTASTSAYGITKLVTSTGSSQTLAATQSGMTTAYNLAKSKYSKPSGGIPKSDLAETVQTSLNKTDIAVTGVTMNGSAKTITNGVVNLGTVITTATTSTSSSVLTVEGGILKVPTATTGKTGMVQLESSTFSTSETRAATPKAINDIYKITNSIDDRVNIFSPYSIQWGTGNYVDLNNFVTSGTYKISGIRGNNNDNIPIINTGGKIEATLLVMVSPDDCISQILTLLNAGGGDTNIYTRTKQNGEWKPWGKLQTNIEINTIGLGQQKNFDDFIDNGMYSGVNVIYTGTDGSNNPTYGYETFVLVVVNGYFTGAGVTQLKYGIDNTGEYGIQMRTKINNNWSEWYGINETPEMIIENATGTMYLSPNIYYKINNVSNVEIKFINSTPNKMNNYMFQMTTNSSVDAPQIALPSSIKWANENRPIFKKNHTYQISVINNLGVFTEF